MLRDIRVQSRQYPPNRRNAEHYVDRLLACIMQRRDVSALVGGALW